VTVDLDIRRDAHSSRDALRADVLAGLTATPKSLPPKWFYDARGSDLFDRITRLPEYYPTRTERDILRAHAADIAERVRADTLVELGSGTSEKTRLLLDALRQVRTLRRFVPIDVDPTVLRSAAASLSTDYPGLHVHGIVGDFELPLGSLPGGDRRLVSFLGSTIGNLDPGARHRLLAGLREPLGPGDAFLLGTDMVKDPGRLLAAYDDAAGVTAEFNRNVLAVINRELHADFDLGAFDHVAAWDPDAEWIEMRLRSRRAQTVTVDDLDLTVRFAAGEEMRTEISAKFRRDGVGRELAAAGFEVVQWWTDPAGDFALSLSVPV
jgi:L-histidine N-alpha-methyltransferase